MFDLYLTVVEESPVVAVLERLVMDQEIVDTHVVYCGRRSLVGFAPGTFVDVLAY